MDESGCSSSGRGLFSALEPNVILHILHDAKIPCQALRAVAMACKDLKNEGETVLARRAALQVCGSRRVQRWHQNTLVHKDTLMLRGILRKLRETTGSASLFNNCDESAVVAFKGSIGWGRSPSCDQAFIDCFDPGGGRQGGMEADWSAGEKELLWREFWIDTEAEWE